MTPLELTELIRNGPSDQLVLALGPLTESERKKLSKTVVEFRKLCAKARSADMAARLLAAQELHGPPVPCPYCGKTPRTPKAKQCFECGKDLHNAQDTPESPINIWNAQSEARLTLAILAVAPWGEAQRIRVWNAAPNWAKEQNSREHLFQVLRDRKPDWLGKWVDKELDQRNFADWQFVRRLVRAELCPKPQSENYTLKMLNGFFSYDRKQSLKDRLLDDPSLLDDEIWRVFEISPVRETIFYIGDINYVPRGDYPCFSWSRTLLDLSVEGKLDRQRLLSASLGSLARNTEPRNTAWFHKFHELLQPTLDEREKLQATYVQLLNHPVPSVVGMALDALAFLQKGNRLDLPGFLDAVGPVFHLKPKAQPLAAVKLLGRTGALKGHASRLAEVLLSGLSHPSVQVQEAIVQLLGKVREEATDVIASMLPVQLEYLAPSLQDRARQLIAEQATEAPTTVDSSAASLPSDLIEEARQIPSPWREAAGIDAVLKAIEGDGELLAVSFDPMRVPRLFADQRVPPIQTLDELIERLTIAIEELDDAIEFELLVDGLSRLCAQRPDDFQGRVAPMLLRIEKLLPPHPSFPLTMSAGGLRMALFKLILRWCDRDVRETKEERDSILGFLDVRLGIVSVRIRNRQAAPLLACPTHRQGWIDPAAMASRLEVFQQHGLEPAKHDFIQGILRLAPDGRAETLAKAASLQGKYAAAFRHALGEPLEDTSLPAAVLIAAGRARTPFGELTDLRFVEDGSGPDALQAARYSWQVIPPESARHGARLTTDVEPAVPSAEKVRDLPNVLLHLWKANKDFAWAIGTGGLNRWLGTVWPSNLDSFYCAGACIYAGQYAEAYFLRQRAAFVGPLFDPEVPFTEITQVLIALCLNEALPEVTGLAVDALVELIRDGRCVGPELGGVLGRMVPFKFMKLNRLGKHLETVARASLLHTHVCAEIVQTSCTPLTEIPKDLHCLLGPLLEWLSALEQGVRAELRSVLEKTTTGKTGALAKKLLQLKHTPNKRALFLMEALKGRVQRARRWAGAH